MIRIKMVKDYKDHRKGQVLNVSPNEAFGLIDRGVAIMTKDFVAEEYQVKKMPKDKYKKLEEE